MRMSLRVAIEANLASQRSMGAKQITQLKERLAALGTHQPQILDKSLSGVFSDSNTRELLSEAEQEPDNLQRQIAVAEGSEIVPEQVIKTGLAVLQDMGTFWQKSSLTTRQRFQRFLFPEEMTIGESGLEPVRPAVCLVARLLQLWDRPESVTVPKWDSGGPNGF
jgi:hypothetical protein